MVDIQEIRCYEELIAFVLWFERKKGETEFRMHEKNTMKQCQSIPLRLGKWLPQSKTQLLVVSQFYNTKGSSTNFYTKIMLKWGTINQKCNSIDKTTKETKKAKSVNIASEVTAWCCKIWFLFRMAYCWQTWRRFTIQYAALRQDIQNGCSSSIRTQMNGNALPYTYFVVIGHQNHGSTHKMGMLRQLNNNIRRTGKLNASVAM